MSNLDKIKVLALASVVVLSVWYTTAPRGVLDMNSVTHPFVYTAWHAPLYCHGASYRLIRESWRESGSGGIGRHFPITCITSPSPGTIIINDDGATRVSEDNLGYKAAARRAILDEGYRNSCLDYNTDVAGLNVVCIGKDSLWPMNLYSWFGE